MGAMISSVVWQVLLNPLSKILGSDDSWLALWSRRPTEKFDENFEALCSFKIYVNFYVTFYVFLGKVEQGLKLNTEGVMDM